MKSSDFVTRALVDVVLRFDEESEERIVVSLSTVLPNIIYRRRKQLALKLLLDQGR